jgi:hypothetical protein
MNETKSHPGVLPIDQRSFNQYTKFIETNELSTQEQKWLQESLEAFYLETMNLPIWLPSQCRLIDLALDKLLQSFSPATCTIRRFGRSHYWYEVKMPSGTKGNIVVDPTEMPEDRKTAFQSEKYIPYFGLINQARGLHGEFYRNGQKLDIFGTDIPEDDLIEFHSLR